MEIFVCDVHHRQIHSLDKWISGHVGLGLKFSKHAVM